MDKASEIILALRPVTLRYKPDPDLDGVSQFGLVADDPESDSRKKGKGKLKRLLQACKK